MIKYWTFAALISVKTWLSSTNWWGRLCGAIQLNMCNIFFNQPWTFNRRPILFSNLNMVKLSQSFPFLKERVMQRLILENSLSVCPNQSENSIFYLDYFDRWVFGTSMDSRWLRSEVRIWIQIWGQKNIDFVVRFCIT